MKSASCPRQKLNNSVSHLFIMLHENFHPDQHARMVTCHYHFHQCVPGTVFLLSAQRSLSEQLASWTSYHISLKKRMNSTEPCHQRDKCRVYTSNLWSGGGTPFEVGRLIRMCVYNPPNTHIHKHTFNVCIYVYTHLCVYIRIYIIFIQ